MTAIGAVRGLAKPENVSLIGWQRCGARIDENGLNRNGNRLQPGSEALLGMNGWMMACQHHDNCQQAEGAADPALVHMIKLLRPSRVRTGKPFQSCQRMLMSAHKRELALNMQEQTPMPNAPSAMAQLVTIMAQLRNPQGGCAWDLAQDFASIAPYTIEEAYEVADAIARNDLGDLRDELGDLLLQVVFHAQMAKEAGAFDIEGVIAAINDKMIRRHPHVFGDASQRSATDQTQAWETQKASERAAKQQSGVAASALDGVALALPALKRAQKLQARAARVGFDWPNADGAFAKIDEEVSEIKTALAANAPTDKITDEVGDLLFSAVNVARHLGVDAETALARASEKFAHRFKSVEALAAETSGGMASLSLDELEQLWLRAKQL